MTIIKNILSAFLALILIACMGVFLVLQVFDTDQYLPQLDKNASLILGRPVVITHVGLGLSHRGVTLDAGPLTIADDPDFTTQPFIEIQRVRINVDLRSLVLQRKVHITGILLQSPEIHFIRSEEGSLNVRSLNPKSQKNLVILSAGPLTGHSLVAPKDLNKINSIRDSSATPQNDGNSSNETINPIPATSIKSLNLQDADISLIDQSIPLDFWFKNINANINGFSLSKPFRLSFDASLYSHESNVQCNALVSIDASKKVLHISNLSLRVEFVHLDMEALEGISPQMRGNSFFKNITGVMQLNLAHLDIGGSGDIQADGNMMLTNGLIKNFNIIEFILSRTVGAFGNFNGLLSGPLKEALNANDTVIKRAQVKFSFHDKTFFVDDSSIKTNIFELTAKGSVDQALNTDLQTVLYLNEDVSAALVNELGGLRYLMDDSKRIAIEGSLKGSAPHLKYKPSKSFKKRSKRFLMSFF